MTALKPKRSLQISQLAEKTSELVSQAVALKSSRQDLLRTECSLIEHSRAFIDSVVSLSLDPRYPSSNLASKGEWNSIVHDSISSISKQNNHVGWVGTGMSPQKLIYIFKVPVVISRLSIQAKDIRLVRAIVVYPPDNGAPGKPREECLGTLSLSNASCNSNKKAPSEYSGSLVDGEMSFVQDGRSCSSLHLELEVEGDFCYVHRIDIFGVRGEIQASRRNSCPDVSKAVDGGDYALTGRKWHDDDTGLDSVQTNSIPALDMLGKPPNRLSSSSAPSGTAEDGEKYGEWQHAQVFKRKVGGVVPKHTFYTPRDSFNGQAGRKSSLPSQ